MEPTRSHRSEGPAEYFRIGGLGTVGFISPISGYPCPFCNRLRLRADGRMYPCLLRSAHVDLKDTLRDGSSVRLETLLDQAIALKYANTRDPETLERFPMCVLGG